MNEPHERWMRSALELAGAAARRGDEPFGALLVVNDASVMTARNAINTSGDLTQHAELRLLSKASRKISSPTLAAAVLYTSTEPCPMCSGAIVWAGIKTVVFGCPARLLHEITGSSGIPNPAELILGDRPGMSLIGPVLEPEAAAIHRAYW